MLCLAGEFTPQKLVDFSIQIGIVNFIFEGSIGLNFQIIIQTEPWHEISNKWCVRPAKAQSSLPISAV